MDVAMIKEENLGTELRGVIFFLYVVGVILVSVVRFGSLTGHVSKNRTCHTMKQKTAGRQAAWQASK